MKMSQHLTRGVLKLVVMVEREGITLLIILLQLYYFLASQFQSAKVVWVQLKGMF